LIERLRADRRTLPILAALVALGGIVAATNPTFAQAGTYAAIYAIAAIGLSILLGNVNQISIGQAGFFALGAYSVAYFTATLNWPFWPALAVGIVVAALAGVVVGFIALRFRGHYLAMATLAFGLIVYGVIHEASFLGGANGISDIPYARLGPLSISGVAAYWFAWIVALAVAVLSLALLHGRTGYAVEAIRNDELAASVAGIATRRYKIAAFAYAGALAGLAGGIYAAFLGLIVPDSVSVPLSIDILLMVVLGGTGGVSGAIMGAVLIGTLDIAGHQFENWREVGYGLLVIVVVIAAPGGLAGFLRRSKPRAAAAPSMGGQAALRDAPGERVTAFRPETAPLTVTNVTKRFGGLLAVDGVSFTLERGTLTSVIGPNGAGKTTLFNAITGVGTLTSGRIEIAGIDVTGKAPHEIVALGVGRTFQNARLFAEMTVLENVAAGALRTGNAVERARGVLADLDLERIADVPAKDLPFGDRRRVELARALAADPWLLFVDEPAAGLNASERTRLLDDLVRLRARGLTLLLIEHDMKLVMAISDRVMVLEFGRKIADGPPDVVRNDPAVVAAYLGTSH
jgi:branched-chain amino acid transport system permease protein